MEGNGKRKRARQEDWRGKLPTTRSTLGEEEGERGSEEGGRGLRGREKGGEVVDD
jgi:hypothetical protein